MSGIEWTASENSFVGFAETLTAAKSQFGSVEKPASKNSLGGHGGYRFRLEEVTAPISGPGPLEGSRVARFKKVKWPVRVQPPVSMKKTLPSFIMAEMVRWPCTTARIFFTKPL